MREVRIVDSHTAGEPTRLVVDGGPDLGAGTLGERRRAFALHHDAFRSAVVCEPRGSEALVGALLCPPAEPGSLAGLIFFNNAGYLGMCGHGAIGALVSLARLGRAGPGDHRLDTPAGTVSARLWDDGRRVTVDNVPSYRLAAGVCVEVEGHGPVSGDVAWGGNWFFLTRDHGQELAAARLPALAHLAARIREALERGGIRGEGRAPIDHVELLGPGGAGADGRNFVLCPGGAYDRSPCGTGTSAELACLAAEGRLGPGETWVQESIVGTRFVASYTPGAPPGRILPRITGSAFVTLEGRLLLDPQDPLVGGLRAGSGGADVPARGGPDV